MTSYIRQPLWEYGVEVAQRVTQATGDIPKGVITESSVAVYMQRGYSPEEAANEIVKSITSNNPYRNRMKDLIDSKQALSQQYYDNVKQVDEQLKELQDGCPHEHTQIESEYVSGDYYNRAYTEERTFCLDCGKCVKEERVNHDNYS